MKYALLGTNRDLRTEARAHYYAIIPHTENSDAQKTITYFTFAIWGASYLLYQLGYPAPPEMWALITGFVAWRLATIKEQEAARLDSEDSD